MKRLVQVTGKQIPQTAKPDLAYKKNGLILDIDESEIIQEDESSKHFLQNTLPELTSKALKLMGISGLEVKPVLKNLFVCRTGGSVKFTHSSSSGNNHFT